MTLSREWEKKCQNKESKGKTFLFFSAHQPILDSWILHGSHIAFSKQMQTNWMRCMTYGTWRRHKIKQQQQEHAYPKKHNNRTKVVWIEWNESEKREREKKSKKVTRRMHCRVCVFIVEMIYVTVFFLSLLFFSFDFFLSLSGCSCLPFVRLCVSVLLTLFLLISIASASQENVRCAACFGYKD